MGTSFDKAPMNVYNISRKYNTMGILLISVYFGICLAFTALIRGNITNLIQFETLGLIVILGAGIAALKSGKIAFKSYFLVLFKNPNSMRADSKKFAITFADNLTQVCQLLTFVLSILSIGAVVFNIYRPDQIGGYIAICFDGYIYGLVMSSLLGSTLSEILKNRSSKSLYSKKSAAHFIEALTPTLTIILVIRTFAFLSNSRDISVHLSYAALTFLLGTGIIWAFRRTFKREFKQYQLSPIFKGAIPMLLIVLCCVAYSLQFKV